MIIQFRLPVSSAAWPHFKYRVCFDGFAFSNQLPQLKTEIYHCREMFFTRHSWLCHDWAQNSAGACICVDCVVFYRWKMQCLSKLYLLSRMWTSMPKASERLKGFWGKVFRVCAKSLLTQSLIKVLLKRELFCNVLFIRHFLLGFPYLHWSCIEISGICFFT